MQTKTRRVPKVPAASGEDSTRPLSALLSQILVAYTVEFNNEFERRMSDAGYAGANLSWVVWFNVMQFVGEAEVTVQDLAAKALAPIGRTKFELGCLERWGYVVLHPDSEDHRPVRRTMHPRARRELRDGWGSGRGIRAEWMVRAGTRGRKAVEIWPQLFPMMEERWETRFGTKVIRGLREALLEVVDQLEFELPDALPEYWEGVESFPERVTRDSKRLALPSLISRLLMAFKMEFDRESSVSLSLCANTLRVLGEKPIRAGNIAQLTGASPEMSDIGWRLKPYVVVEPDPTAKRGKVIRLSGRGLAAQAEYRRLVAEVEGQWEERFGRDKVRELRECLRGLFTQREADRLPLSAGLVPPKGVVRAGEVVPALGRRTVGAAARQRARNLVEQTEAFVRDPSNALPHFPLWDMNRGFGP
jgi:hypothetical protein